MTLIYKALEEPRHGYFRSKYLYEAADIFRAEGHWIEAATCKRAAEGFWGDDTELEKLCST